MIELDDPDALLALNHFARSLAALNDRRVDVEVEAIRARAVDTFMRGGDTDIESFLRADALIARLRGFIAKHRLRAAERGLR